MIRLFLSEIEDDFSRENFRRVQNEFNEDVLKNSQFTFITITFTGAETNYKYKHNLPFVPRDVIQTSLTGSGSLTWNYSLFDSTNLDITTTDACVVRALIGKVQ